MGQPAKVQSISVLTNQSTTESGRQAASRTIDQNITTYRNGTLTTTTCATTMAALVIHGYAFDNFSAICDVGVLYFQVDSLRHRLLDESASTMTAATAMTMRQNGTSGSRLPTIAVSNRSHPLNVESITSGTHAARCHEDHSNQNLWCS